MSMEEHTAPWHPEVISPAVASAARTVVRRPSLRDFYLAGGTALALHRGHRRSVDLDFFSAKTFDEDQLIASLQDTPDLAVVSKSPQTLHLHVAGTKISLIGYNYPLLFPLAEFQGIMVADLRDIACMKLSTLASRGSRRDFVDLYVVAQQYGLAHVIELFQQKFAHANYNLLHVRKSLVYFVDAEKEPMPDMLVPLSWGEVKDFFLAEVGRISPP
jgi:Nucleotidyl transferase AbiEii toxin, Type IV TA system